MRPRVLRFPADWGPEDIRALYTAFDAPVTAVDCGAKCAPLNPSGKPFCCDICKAVPAAYTSEWAALQSFTRLWHAWRGDECEAAEVEERAQLEEALPAGMVFLACLGPQACERQNRLVSCRQFPFFPYVTSDYCFAGLAYDWEFEDKCWVIQNLAQVTPAYRDQFVAFHDQLFALFQDEFENYAARSQEMRDHFAARKRRVPLLHRNGGFYLISPGSERARRVALDEFCLPGR